MSTTEAPFVVSHNFCAVRGETVDELINRLREFNANPEVQAEIAAFRGTVATHAAAVAAVQAVAPGTTVIASTPVIEQHAVVSEPLGQLEVVEKWNKKFTYNHPDAPTLARGGRFMLMEGTGPKGPYRGWADPLSGPKPMKADGVEKENTRWI